MTLLGGAVSKRARIIAAVVGIAVVVGIVAFIALGSKGGGPEVEASTATKKELAVTVTASGRIDAGVRADVFPPTAGTLDTIFVSDGETVTAGQKIAAMDTAPIELQVAQARAGLSQARAQLAAIDSQAPGGADLTAARANVDAAYAAYLAAKAGLDAVDDQVPTDAQIDAASASTAVALDAYESALAAFEAYPSNDATRAALQATRDQAYVAYLSAKAAEETLKTADISAARAQASAGVQQAFAAYKGAQAQLAKLRGSDTSAARRAAEAGVRSAAEALSLAEDTLDKATMEAPIDGVVIFNAPGAAAMAAAAGAGTGAGAGDITEGSSVSPAAAPFSVVDLGAVRFTAEVDEADIERVAVGMKGSVTLDSFPGEEFSSQVVRVNPVAQATATGGTVFEVELALDDTGKDVLIGMKGDATIEVSSRGAALTIPVEALFSEGGTDYVYVVKAGKLKKSEITVGAQTDTEVEVLGGLNEGDVVALSGATQYTDGMPVRTK